MNSNNLENYLDRRAAEDTVKEYFWALDHFDWDKVASLIGDEFTLDSDAPGAAPEAVTREEFMRTLKERNGGFVHTLHINSGHLADVDGDTATVRAHMWAAHSVGDETADTFWGYGTYHFELTRQGDSWRLHRQRITVVGIGGEGTPADVFARSMQRQANGQGHY